MPVTLSTDFFDSLAAQTMRSQRLGLPHITRALVFQGIDAMSFAMSHDDRMSKEAFVAWVTRYIHFPQSAVSADELFKARQKHLPALKKRVALRGSGRRIQFVDVPDAPEYVVSGKAEIAVRTDFFADAFLLGMMSFMHELKRDAALAQRVTARFAHLPFGWRAVMGALSEQMRLCEVAGGATVSVG